MKSVRGSKVAIIGAGQVGATIAFALAFQQRCSELVLIDVNKDNLQGTVKELPSREVIDVPVDEMLIVELYSK